MNTRIKLSPLTKWLPSPGSVLFTLLVAAGLLLLAHRVGAFPSTQTQTPSAPSTTTLPYQGRLTDTNGNPVNATKAMTFRLYNVASGGTALWQEAWPGVQVSDGLFNVLLGSTMPVTPTVFAQNNSLWLGITVGTDTEMTPRAQVGSVPFTFQASRAYGLSAADGEPGDAVYVDAKGTVGIGTTLNISGNGSGLWLQNTSSAINEGTFLHWGSDLGAGRFLIFLAGSGYTYNPEWTNDLNLYTPSDLDINFITSDVTRMSIDGSGNVGIGTMNPGVKLHVVQNGSSEGTPDSSSELWVTDNGLAMIGAEGINNAVRTLFSAGSDGTIGGVVGTLSNHSFYIRSNNINRMIFEPGGNVGIGTTNAQHPLDVAGDIYATGNICANNGANCILSPSDLRLKTNIALLTHPLDKLAQMRGVTFDWNDQAIALGLSSEASQIGVIAQEVEAVFPEMVTTLDNGYKAVDYSKLSAVLIEAVKELRAEKDSEIAALQTENTALKDQVSTLDARLTAMEQALAADQPVQTPATRWNTWGILFLGLVIGGWLSTFNFRQKIFASANLFKHEAHEERGTKDTK